MSEEAKKQKHILTPKKIWPEKSETFLWLVKVIRSCETILHVEFSAGLIKQFRSRFPNEKQDYMDMIDELHDRCFELNIDKPIFEVIK